MILKSEKGVYDYFARLLLIYLPFANLTIQAVLIRLVEITHIQNYFLS